MNYPLHVEGSLDRVSEFDDRPLREMSEKDADDAPLSEEGRSVFDDDNLGLEEQRAKDGDFLAQFAVDVALHGGNLSGQSFFFEVYKIFFQVKIASVNLCLRPTEILNLPSSVVS